MSNARFLDFYPEYSGTIAHLFTIVVPGIASIKYNTGHSINMSVTEAMKLYVTVGADKESSKMQVVQQRDCIYFNYCAFQLVSDVL